MRCDAMWRNRWRNSCGRGRRVQALERRWWWRAEVVGNKIGEGMGLLRKIDNGCRLGGKSKSAARRNGEN
ncbi:hypothetical protein LXL04_034532 [Taraxacum kok-saghyz]